MPQKRRKKLHRLAWQLNVSTPFPPSLCKAMSGSTKLMSPKSKLWIVALLLGALQLMLPLASFCKDTFGTHSFKGKWLKLASQSYKTKLLKRRLLRHVATLQLKAFKQKWSNPHEAPGSWALQNDARSFLDLFDIRIYRCKFLPRFSKTCLASQSSWARSTNSVSLHYCLKYFNYWLTILYIYP